MAEPDLDTSIEDAASGVAEARVDGNFAKAVPIDEMIKADQYLLSKDATHSTTKKTGGILLMKLRPPGAP